MAFKKKYSAGGKKKFFKKKVDKEEDVEEEEEDVEEEEENEDGDEGKVKVEKKKVAKTVVKKTTSTSDASDKSIDLVGTAKAPRRILYSNFKGFERIDIREFYVTSDGELRPSQKGIQLTFDQWKIIAENIDTINSWIPKDK